MIDVKQTIKVRKGQKSVCFMFGINAQMLDRGWVFQSIIDISVIEKRHMLDGIFVLDSAFI